MTATIDPTYAAMLAPILADPEDDAPRLTMADFLDENGDPERGEFIRIQCELARPVLECNCAASRKSAKPDAVCQQTFQLNRNADLRSREREFRDKHSAPLWCRLSLSGDPIVVLLPGETPIPSIAHNPQIVLRRGFIDSLTCTAADWITYADSILAEHPVTAVRLTSMILPEEVGKECPKVPLRIWLGSHLRRQWPGIKFSLPNPPYIDF